MPKFSPARLTAARIQAGLTQRELATRTGKRNAVNTYESGRVVPPDYAVGLLARALGISAAVLYEPDPTDPVLSALAQLDEAHRETELDADHRSTCSPHAIECAPVAA
ncbi:multiprotein-bridging factor 1 family protein [Streptomyces sp. NPDC059861]|uniref:helix-turn-helix domain-containing protein n=1 Tax=Streptomyces sp. NPDC059861 TaxID=3346974 RepID=UPI003664982A